MQNGSMLIVWPDGALARVHIIDPSAADTARQQATETTAPTMVIVATAMPNWFQTENWTTAG